jgi:hypothetical protein
MADYEEAVAREVHTLLLSAKPETTDKDLASAAERASFEKDPKACRSDILELGLFLPSRTSGTRSWRAPATPSGSDACGMQ